MNKKLMFFLLVLSFAFLSLYFSYANNSITSKYLLQGTSSSLVVLLPILLLLLIFTFLSRSNKVLEYKQKSAEFLSKLFDEDPATIVKEDLYYITQTPKYEQLKEVLKGRTEKIRSYYLPTEDKIYYNPRRGYGELVHELAHALRYRKGLSSETIHDLPQVDDIVARMVEDIVSNHSYKSFKEKIEKEIEPYKILDQDLKPIYKARLTYHIIGHALASLYRKGRLKFEDVKRISNLPSDRLVEESIKILEENESNLQPSLKNLMEKLA